MPTLSAEQLSIHQYHANAGDRIAYYTALGAFGFAYGNLALGVVLNNTVSGAAANSFFMDQADEQGVNVSENQLATISLNLMQADFQARQTRGGADLSVDVIQDYHAAVFNSVAEVSANAWTPNRYLLSFDDPADRQAAWDSMLNSVNIATYGAIADRRATVTWDYMAANPQVNQALTIVDIAAMTREELLFQGFDATFADWFLDYSAYLVDLQAAGLDGTFFDPSNHYGPFDVTLAMCCGLRVWVSAPSSTLALRPLPAGRTTRKRGYRAAKCLSIPMAMGRPTSPSP